MTAEVRSLYQSNEDRERIVEALELMLEDAREGRVLSLAVATIRAGNATGGYLVNTDVDPVGLAGQLGVLLHSVNHRIAIEQGIIDSGGMTHGG